MLNYRSSEIRGSNAKTFEIIFPPTGQKLEIRFELGYYDYLLKYQPVKFSNIETAYKVLTKPNRIFCGVKRPLSTTPETLCFVGKPDKWYIRENSLVDFPDRFVYTVYLNSRKSVWDFRAEERDTEDPLSPVGWKIRFGGQIWKNS